MVLHHYIGYKGQQPRFVKGGVKPIQITQEIRTGRKTVTKVSGLEHFMIDVDAFAHELQVLCAGSVASKSATFWSMAPLRCVVDDDFNRLLYLKNSNAACRCVSQIESSRSYGPRPAGQERYRGAAGEGNSQEIY